MNAQPDAYAELLRQHMRSDSPALVYVAEVAWIRMYFLGHELSKALGCLESRGTRRSLKAVRDVAEEADEILAVLRHSTRPEVAEPRAACEALALIAADAADLIERRASKMHLQDMAELVQLLVKTFERSFEERGYPVAEFARVRRGETTVEAVLKRLAEADGAGTGAISYSMNPEESLTPRLDSRNGRLPRTARLRR